MDYRAQGLAQKLPAMSEADAPALLFRWRLRQRGLITFPYV